MNKLFLILGITSFVLAPFDFALEGVYEGFLPLAWAAFFFFLAFRERLATGSSPAFVGRIQWLLGLAVIATGLAKLLNRLDVIG
jgi:hypothetical protein